MIKIEYNETNYQDLIARIARALKLKLIDDCINFPPGSGTGYIRQLTFQNGIELLIYNYNADTSILFQRKKSKKDFFILRLDEILDTTQSAESKSSIFFTNSKFEGLYLTNSDVHVRTVHILIQKEWLDRYLNFDAAGEEIVKFISLKMNSHMYEPMDMEYYRLMHEILDSNQDKRLEKMIIENRVSMIIERFFSRMYKKMTDANFDVNLSTDDISRLKLVQAALLEDFSLPPRSVEELSRMAAMSSSKLKAAFKKMYGEPIYRYYQKHRMNKAKAMLLSKKYSMKEVVAGVGFANQGNFSKAFQQAFDQLPGELMK